MKIEREVFNDEGKILYYDEYLDDCCSVDDSAIKKILVVACVPCGGDYDFRVRGFYDFQRDFHDPCLYPGACSA